MAEEDRRQSSEIIALAQRFKQEGNVQGVVNKGKRSQPRAPRRSNKKSLFFFYIHLSLLPQSLLMISLSLPFSAQKKT